MAADKPDFIIVRRYEPEEEHHGGAWKIALADFMTAMMAFFLVMWLINATDQETKKSIANYFNPIRLAETTADRKGLHNPQGAAPKEAGAPAEAKPNSKSDAGSDNVGSSKDAKSGKIDNDQPATQRRFKETALFSDPYAVLANLAAEAEAQAPFASVDALPGDAPIPGVESGGINRDPFDPLYWHTTSALQMRTETPGRPQSAKRAPRDQTIDVRVQLPTRSDETPVREEAAPMGVAAVTDATVGRIVASLKDTAAGKVGALSMDSAAKDNADARDKAAPRGRPSDAATPAEQRMPAEIASTGRRPSAEAAPAGGDAHRPLATHVAELEAEIGKAVKTSSGQATFRAEVRRTNDGVLISLMDGADFSMFAVGSAEPQPKVVQAMAAVARVLGTHAGGIVIRGHTDGRPFKSDLYDNWRLSTARAHMASYMLLRGGIPENRIERIEGHASRNLRNASDPKAAENRRIEVLVRTPE